MICCFPDPYPDELLYSVSARFHKLMRYRSSIHTSNELFGAKSAGGTIDLPQRLGYLVGALPPEHLYTVDSLIYEHTLLPYYGAFLPSERVARLKEVMHQGGCGGISTRANIRRLKHFQFCSLCVVDDKKLYGQTYWHRVHQTPGVMICHVHNVFLERCDVDLRSKAVRLKFIDADDNTHQSSVRPLDLSNSNHQALIGIAQDTAWLLNQCNLSCEANVLHERFLGLLCDLGLATYVGRLRATELINAFSKYYDPALLELLQCKFDGPYNWLERSFDTRPLAKVR